MDEKLITLVVPTDTTLLGIFSVGKVKENGYIYSSADSNVFLIKDVDTINLINGKTYKIEKGQMVEYISDEIPTEEELFERRRLDQELDELDKEIIVLQEKIKRQEAGAPSTEE